MARTVDSDIQTAAEAITQEVCYCVEVGYSSAKRITDDTVSHWISSDEYEPGSLKITSLVCSGEPSNTATFTVGHDPGSASDWGRLDLAQDTCGKTVKIYEVWQTAAGEKSHLVFEGVVNTFRGGPQQCQLGCRRDAGTSTRPGNYVCWTDEFPHLPQPGTVVNIGNQYSEIKPAPWGEWWS